MNWPFWSLLNPVEFNWFAAPQHRELALPRLLMGFGSGMVLLTSRVSVEMVQKAAALGAPVMVAVSAPTALAVRIADAAGITLVAVARNDGFEIFTHPQRIALEQESPLHRSVHVLAQQ